MPESSSQLALNLFPAGPAGREFAVKSLSRLFLSAGVVLLTATALPAQRFVSASPSASFSGFAGGFGGYGYADYGWGSNFGGWGFGDLHHPEEHAPFGVGFAHGDSDFIQSTYMDYDRAVELGKRILEEEAKPQPSLGEIARQLRLRRTNAVPAPAPHANSGPAASSEKSTVIQGSGGKAILCRSSDPSCRGSA